MPTGQRIRARKPLDGEEPPRVTEDDVARKTGNIAWQNAHAKILAGLDIRAEAESLGLALSHGEPSADGWLSCRAFDREDRTPSAAINLQSGRYRDLGGDGLSLSLWDLAARIGRYPDWRAARDALAAKAGVKLPGTSPPADPAEHLAFRPWNALGDLWCRHKPGVTAEAVLAAGGRLARYRGQYTVVALPILGEQLADADPIGWVLWNVTGGDVPVFRGKGQPPVWRKMKTTNGSESGLMGLHGLVRLQSAPTPEQTVWSVEGPSDLMALWAAIPSELRDTHLVACNSGGAAETPKGWQSRVCADRRAVVVRDADAAGEAGADKWAAWLAGPGGATEVRRVRLPYPVAKDHGKDLRDWLGEGHTFAELQALAEAAPIVQPATADAPGQQLAEADDDPYRLARLFLRRYTASENGSLSLRFWRGEWWLQENDGGRCRYRPQALEAIRGRVSLAVKEEFDHLHRLALAAAEDRDGEPPTVQKVTRPLVANVLAAMESLCALHGVEELGVWIE